MRDHTHGYSASKGIRDSGTQFVIGTDKNTRWFWMRIRNQSLQLARKKACSFNASYSRQRRYRSGAQSKLPHSHLWSHNSRADVRSVRMTTGEEFFEELERAIKESIPKPKMIYLDFPVIQLENALILCFLKKLSFSKKIRYFSCT